MTTYGAGNPHVIDHLGQDAQERLFLHYTYLPALYGYPVEDSEMDEWHPVDEINAIIKAARREPYAPFDHIVFDEPDCLEDAFHFDATFSANVSFGTDVLDLLDLEQVALLMPTYNFAWNTSACFSSRDWAVVISTGILGLENEQFRRLFLREASNAAALKLNF
jgi:hypothetical protein